MYTHTYMYTYRMGGWDCYTLIYIAASHDTTHPARDEIAVRFRRTCSDAGQDGSCSHLEGFWTMM